MSKEGRLEGMPWLRGFGVEPCVRIDRGDGDRGMGIVYNYLYHIPSGHETSLLRSHFSSLH